MNDMNIIPATPDLLAEDTNVQVEVPESSYMKFAAGYNNVGKEIDEQEVFLQSNDEVGNDNPSVKAVPEQDDGQSAYEIDGVDLSYVPNNLRRATIAETLSAVEDSRKNAESTMTQKATEASNLKKMIQDQGYRDPTAMQVSNRLKSVQDDYAEKLRNAEEYYLRQIDNGAITEAEANFEYGQYAANLDSQKNQNMQQEYVSINSGLIETMIGKYEPLLKNPSVSAAAEGMLRDIIQDGDLIDEQRTQTYFELGQGIWDEAFKAGKEAAKANDQASQEDLIAKQRMSSTQIQRKAPATKAKSSYNSPEDVPQEVWNERADIRASFGL